MAKLGIGEAPPALEEPLAVVAKEQALVQEEPRAGVEVVVGLGLAPALALPMLVVAVVVLAAGEGQPFAFVGSGPTSCDL